MAKRNDLQAMAAESRAEYGQAIRRLRRELKRLDKARVRLHAHAEKHPNDPTAYKYQHIHQVNLDESILLDKIHELLVRIRELESFGEERETEIGEVVVVQEADGTEYILGEPPRWTSLVSQAGISPAVPDPESLH